MSEDSPAREWRVTPYMPSHKMFSLPKDLTPERITELVGEPKRGSPDGKCDYTWEFFASAHFKTASGEWTEITLPCSIWDYKGSRWSGYGPSEAFLQLGLLAKEGKTDA